METPKGTDELVRAHIINGPVQDVSAYWTEFGCKKGNPKSENPIKGRTIVYTRRRVELTLGTGASSAKRV